MSNSIPQHVAIIMDGNGRWAEKRRLPRTAGHREGAKSVQRVVDAALLSGVKYLTLFGFSSENWNRDQEEVNELMSLLRRYLKNETKQLIEKEIRFSVIGDRTRLEQDIVDMIQKAEADSRSFEKLHVVLALSYGGRDEIIRACQKMEGDVTAERFEAALDTAGIPDPDLLVRTSGEQRISNFLLWQMAYTELYFTDTLWPDFGEKDFEAALQDYQSRHRRFGK